MKELELDGVEDGFENGVAANGVIANEVAMDLKMELRMELLMDRGGPKLDIKGSDPRMPDFGPILV